MPNQISNTLKGYCPHCFTSRNFNLDERRGAIINCANCEKNFTVLDSEKIILSEITEGMCPHCGSGVHFTLQQRAGSPVLCVKCKNDFLLSDIHILPKYSEINYVKKLEELMSPNGKVGRKEFLYSYFGIALGNFVFITFLVAIFGNTNEYMLSSILTLIVFLAWGISAWAVICLGIRRLRDINEPPATIIVAFIPILNIILLLWLLLTPSKNK